MAWQDSDPVHRILSPAGPTGCGCRARARAEEHPDAQASEEARVAHQFAEHADERARGWRCPNAGFPRPQAGDPPLDAMHQEALDAVGRLTGARGLRTCPHWYLEHPDLAHALAAWRAEKNGQLRERVGWPSLALYQAVEQVDASFTARRVYEMKPKEERESDG